MGSISKQIANSRLTEDEKKVFAERLRRALLYEKKAKRLAKEYKDTWSTEKFIRKLYHNNPRLYKPALKKMEEGAKPLKALRTCMICGKEGEGRLGTLAEMCRRDVRKLAEEFGHVTIVRKRANYYINSKGEKRPARCPWCGKPTTMLYMVNIFVCEKCMKKLGELYGSDNKSK